ASSKRENTTRVVGRSPLFSPAWPQHGHAARTYASPQPVNCYLLASASPTPDRYHLLRLRCLSYFLSSRHSAHHRDHREPDAIVHPLNDSDDSFSLNYTTPIPASDSLGITVPADSASPLPTFSEAMSKGASPLWRGPRVRVSQSVRRRFTNPTTL